MLVGLAVCKLPFGDVIAIRLCPPNCGDALKPSNTKPVEPIDRWPSRELGYGNSFEGCTWVIRSQASASLDPPVAGAQRGRFIDYTGVGGSRAPI